VVGFAAAGAVGAVVGAAVGAAEVHAPRKSADALNTAIALRPQ
jgi:hypothetical protein